MSGTSSCMNIKIKMEELFFILTDIVIGGNIHCFLNVFNLNEKKLNFKIFIYFFTNKQLFNHS